MDTTHILQVSGAYSLDVLEHRDPRNQYPVHLHKYNTAYVRKK
jgi:hypothetical protein